MITKYKKVIALFLCLFILLPSLKGIVPILVSFFPSMPNIVYAEDYTEQERDKESQTAYYMVKDSKQFKELFDFDISDVDNVFDWAFNFKTYTIIAKSQQTGEYTMYFNTPNLQSIVKNEIIGNINDGYTDDTYNINETEWIVDVGTNILEDKENIITKYGFKIPNYIYQGEYPKATMSVAGIVPTKWYSILWNFIKGLLGFSFLDAPDASSFNTITYLNHRYGDTNYWVLDFFKKYYVKYFVQAIPENTINGDEYFSGPEQFNSMYVSDDTFKASDSWKKSNVTNYQTALACSNLWNNLHKNVAAVPATDTTAEVPAENTTVDESVFFSKDNLESNEDFATAIPFVNNIHELVENDSTYNPRNSDPDYQYLAWNDAYSLKEVLLTKLDKCDAYKNAVNTYRNKTEVIAIFGDPEEDYALNLDAQKKLYEAISDPVVRYYEIEEEEEGSTEEGSTEEDSSSSTPDISTVQYSEWETMDHTNLIVVGLEVNGAPISFDDYKKLVSGVQLVNNYQFIKETLFSHDEEQIISEWKSHTEIIDKYKKFTEMFDRGDEVSYAAKMSGGAKIPYKQCMIASEKDNECYNTKFGGEKISLSVGSIYAQSELYKEIDMSKHSNGEELTTEEAQKVIRKLQTICGPYYSEVLQNMIILMSIVGFTMNDESPLALAEVNSKDARVMPYDVATLVPADKISYNVRDPRVELYKSHIIGYLVSNFGIKLVFSTFFKPQKMLIDLGGKITELSVKFQQLINFDWLEEAGLSPANMWSNVYVTLLMIFVAIFFIAKTVISIFKMGTKSAGKIIISFIFFFLELGIITSIALAPKETWEKMKDINNYIMTFGERLTPQANNEQTAYLFEGNNENEILFYLPYIDMWSRFNTGYNLQDDEQYFDIEDYFANPSKYPELKDIEIEEGSKETKLPKLKGKTDVKHYSIVLADAFSYYGYSTSVTDSIGVSHENDSYIPEGVSKTVNGTLINNNAYRVVDHFMSPRVTITEKDEKTLNFTITENENFNDEFQSGVIDMLTKLGCCILGCIISLFKFITFLWFWWVLYIFIFRVLLGQAAEHKKWGHLLVETFGPLLVIVFLGLYAGMVFQLTMNVNGLIGLILIIVMFKITFRLVPVWQRTANGLLFPLPLKPIADLISSRIRKKEYASNMMAGDTDEGAYTDAAQEDWRRRFATDFLEENRERGQNFDKIPEEDFSDFSKLTDHLFDENFNMKIPNCKWAYVRWIQWYRKEYKWSSGGLNQFCVNCWNQNHIVIENWEKEAEKTKMLEGQDYYGDYDKTRKVRDRKDKKAHKNDPDIKINEKIKKKVDKATRKHKK